MAHYQQNTAKQTIQLLFSSKANSMAKPFSVTKPTTRRSASSSSTTFRTSNASSSITNATSANKTSSWQPPVRFVTTSATVITQEDASWSSCSTHDDSLSESSPRRTLFPQQQQASSPSQLRSRKSIESSSDDDDGEWFLRQYATIKEKPTTRISNTALVPWLLALVSLTSVSMIFVMNHNVGSTAQHDVFILHTQPRSKTQLRHPNLHQLALTPKQQIVSSISSSHHHRRHRRIHKPSGSLSASPWPLDPSLYKSNDTETQPRVVLFHKSAATTKPRQKIKPYKSIYTDETQTYDRTDSSDLPTMERTVRHDDDVHTECHAMADWQTTVYPSCNRMHEIELADLTLFGMKGFWRNAWRYDASEDETVVLKTLRYVVRYLVSYVCSRTILRSFIR